MENEALDAIFVIPSVVSEANVVEGSASCLPPAKTLLAAHPAPLLLREFCATSKGSSHPANGAKLRAFAWQ
jgi:hypothetical protein